MRTAAEKGKSLRQFLAESNLPSDVLIDSARACDWLMGDETASVFFRAGLAKAQAEYADVAPGDPVAHPLLHAVAQTKALWRLKDWTDLESRFQLVTALDAPVSAGALSRRFRCAVA